MPSSNSFLRQLSARREAAWRSSNSRNWGPSNSCSNSVGEIGGFFSKKMEGLNHMYYGHNGNINNNVGLGLGVKKRVMVVVDQKSYSKHAMIWALTHAANKGDLLTLLHIVPPYQKASGSDSSPYLAKSLGSLCKACKPEVEVEALVIQGPKLATVMNQVKKLDVAVLVLGQKKPSPFLNCLCGNSSSEEFVEQCINNVECLTIGVSKQSKSVGGYLISTRWKKNFWLLA